VLYALVGYFSRTSILNFTTLSGIISVGCSLKERENSSVTEVIVCLVDPELVFKKSFHFNSNAGGYIVLVSTLKNLD